MEIKYFACSLCHLILNTPLRYRKLVWMATGTAEALANIMASPFLHVYTPIG